MTDKFARALRAFDELPGIVIVPVTYMGVPSYQMNMTDEARAVVSEMMGVRPALVERSISARIVADAPLFTHRVTAIDPSQEGNH